MLFQFIPEFLFLGDFAAIRLQPLLDLQSSRRVLIGDHLEGEVGNIVWSFLQFEQQFSLHIVDCVLFESLCHSHDLRNSVVVGASAYIRVDQVPHEASPDHLLEPPWIQQVHNSISC